MKTLARSERLLSELSGRDLSCRNLVANKTGA